MGDSLCGDVDETVDHLFLHCSFARKRWCRSRLSFGSDEGIDRRFKDRFADCIKMAAGGNTIYQFVCVLWEIWCARKRACFNLAAPAVECCHASFDSIISLC